MSLSLTNESKNTAVSFDEESKNDLTLTNESRGHTGMTLADASWSLAEAEGTLSDPRMVLAKEDKL